LYDIFSVVTVVDNKFLYQMTVPFLRLWILMFYKIVSFLKIE